MLSLLYHLARCLVNFNHSNITCLLPDHELRLTHCAYGEYLPFEGATTDNFEILCHIDEIELVGCAYKKMSALHEGAVHQIDRKLLINFITPMRYHIYFARRITHYHIFG